MHLIVLVHSGARLWQLSCLAVLFGARWGLSGPRAGTSGARADAGMVGRQTAGLREAVGVTDRVFKAIPGRFAYLSGVQIPPRRRMTWGRAEGATRLQSRSHGAAVTHGGLAQPRMSDYLHYVATRRLPPCVRLVHQRSSLGLALERHNFKRHRASLTTRSCS